MFFFFILPYNFDVLISKMRPRCCRFSASFSTIFQKKKAVSFKLLSVHKQEHGMQVPTLGCGVLDSGLKSKKGINPKTKKKKCILNCLP